jgi:hypothetical protein
VELFLSGAGKTSEVSLEASHVGFSGMRASVPSAPFLVPHISEPKTPPNPTKWDDEHVCTEKTVSFTCHLKHLHIS